MRILGIGEEVGAGRVREEEHVYTPILAAKLDRCERMWTKDARGNVYASFFLVFFLQ